MRRYTSPVNPAVFPHLTVMLLATVHSGYLKELLISLVASLFMGFGVLFLLLWVGIYV
ncbi:unnamed protein product [Nyctereutes procyonoides]|uniref:Dolichyl-diphosphooligosaccharide-protein glycosyltransferase subunit TMEM258 n=1 Tax=Nyctereutes procyonoides TaxID=34880 RepID=A0A811ZCY8_NYCPR|nr:unnamed protein product [Nyctereutes procyonoides]